jgi:putative transposase
MGVDQTERRAKPAFKTRKRDQIAHQMPEPWQTVPKRLDTCATQLQHGREDIPLGECRLNVLDDFNREGLCIEVDFSLPAERVVRSLDRIIEWRGKPQTIRVPSRDHAAHNPAGQWTTAQNISAGP